MTKKMMMLAAAAAVAIGACAETETVGGYTWTYRINGDTAEIYNGYSAAISPSPVGAVTVPDTLGGKTVVSVGNYAFYNCSSLTRVTIPNTVTNVGSYAFGDCSLLASVTLPSSLKVLGANCFQECTVLPAITIPYGLSQIPEYCFYDCSSLQSVELPNTVTAIGDYAFGGGTSSSACKSLVSITLPTSLKTIGSNTFCYSGLTSIVIPEGVIGVGAYAFYDCDELKSVLLSGTMVSLGEYAFSSCDSLASVWMEDGTIALGKAVFSNCQSLRSIRLSNGLTGIGASVFSSAGLESVVIPASVVSLGADSFNCSYYDYDDYQYCYLTNVVFRGALPAGINVSKILDHAKSVYYPLAFASSYLEYVDDSIFAGYTETFTFDDDPPGLQTYIVSYNANGGSGTMANQTFAIGTAQALSANVFTRANYSFLGWSKSAGGGATYTDRQIVKDLTTTAGGTVALYAIWQASSGGGSEPSIISNDNFVDAEYLTGASGFVSGSNSDATIENGESKRYDSKKTVWYSWKAPLTGVAVFDTLRTVDTYGAEALEDSILGVYTGNSIETMSEVAFNDDADTGDYFESRVSFNVYKGTTYRIVVGGSGRSSGKFLLNWNANEQSGGGSGTGGGSSGSGGEAESDSRYILSDVAADRAIASITVSADCAIDSFVLKEGKVYDSMIRIVNIADREVRISLPTGYTYEKFKGTSPLAIPPNSTNMLTITRTANKVFMVSREEMESAL